MPDNKSVWDESILQSMKPGHVTFAWDDGEIRTVQAPNETLDSMQSAWEWINPKLRELEAERGKPRSVCFKLTDGRFRGLRFPDWNPGVL
jgi:hypothetical protein